MAGHAIDRSRTFALTRAAAICLCVAFLGVIWLAVARAGMPVDAYNYVAAGQRLNDGHALYALSPGDWAVRLEPPYWTVPLLSPPAAAVLGRPFAIFGIAGVMAWWAIMGFALAFTIGVLAVRLPFATLAAIVMLANPLRLSLGVGNLSSLIASSVVLVWWSTHRNRELIAGAILGPLVALKLVPILLVLWLVGQRRWRAVAAAAATLAISLLVSVLGAGIAAYTSYLSVIHDTYGPGLTSGSVGGLTHSTTFAFAATGAVVVMVLLTRSRPTLSFALAVVGMLLGSPVVNPDWPVLLLGLVAPLAWPPSGKEPARLLGYSRDRRKGGIAAVGGPL